MEATETVESVLSELAERLMGVPYPAPARGMHLELDERFAALRGEHEYADAFSCVRCGKFNPDEEYIQDGLRWGHLSRERVVSTPYCLRTDLGSLVRAAAACGFLLIFRGPMPSHAIPGWHVTPQRWEATDWKGFGVGGEGDTPELAAALALKAAVA